MRLVRRLKAIYHRVPFQIKEFWNANCKDDKKIAGLSVKRFNESTYCGLGDTVGLLETKDGGRHIYKIIGITRFPGDDHIMSPYDYDLEYLTTVSKSQYDKMIKNQESLNKGKIRLLNNW